MEIDHKIYLGIVVQNNDPEMRGRIKIYIPQKGPMLKNLYTDNENKNVDKFFNFIGQETKNNTISTIFEDLKKVLPWAEYAGPIAGGNATGRYNGFVGEGTTSDSNAWQDNKPVEGSRPSQNYIGVNTYADAFTETGLHKNKYTNQYAYQYTPSNYSNLARGLFSIPNVGAHVYCFFINGDENFPVYFASAYSQDDIKRIYTMSSDQNENNSVDYPASYENISKSNNNPTLTEDNKTFRSKTILNSNKHTIELIDTDLREILKFTHYSGSFKEFNNYANIELAINNDQKLVIGDQFITVKHNKSEYIKGNNDHIISGDRYLNIGETNIQKVKDILNIHKQIHKYKLLFDVQRAQYGEVTTDGNPNDMSPLQNRNGITGEIGANGMPLFSNGFIQCPICGGKPYDPYDLAYGDPLLMWAQVPYIKDPLESCLIADKSLLFFTILNSGTCYSVLNPYSTEETTQIVPPCEPATHPFELLTGYYRGMRCPCCKGTGFSPSTQDGNFLKDPAKLPGGELDKTIQRLSPQLFQLEKELGLGGDEIKTVSMNKIETIGLVMNDMQSFRVDPIGKLKIDGCWVSPQGTFENFKPSPHVEYVDVADIPGGDYNLTCMNKYKLLVGARGINIMTHGPLDIYGTICNFTGEQVNISSKNEVVIDGGERLSLRARKISLVPVNHNAVVVEGQLHVTRNSIFEGGIMCEGEVALLHVTAPAAWYRTEQGFYELAADEMCPLTIKIEAVGGVVPSLAGNPGSLKVDGVIMMPKHYHPYQSLPMSLYPHKEAVRTQMVQLGINSRTTIAAIPPTQNFSLSDALASMTALPPIETPEPPEIEEVIPPVIPSTNITIPDGLGTKVLER